MFKMKIAFFAVMMLMAGQVSHADGPCPESDPDLAIENCTYEIQSGKVAVQYAEAGVIPMDLRDCEELYEYSLKDCLQLKDLKLDCEEHGRNYSGSCNATMSGITEISNNPGFVLPALRDICVGVCQTGRMIPFDEFKKKVCSIPAGGGK